ncbi:uncharacterized protein EAF02_004730 [Botrytis sinoallii]|uniref:uncharacterized protein n=1 Tax=Botrytis sinoallii TaxID=1463999 RepID=UPI001901CAF8|nr:uncharacterized protein EAF02_004730 [Botrytis sinoallii]KAF7884394.1 hypothetical protein EAF02_004730 [Botrytis sinoallii]
MHAISRNPSASWFTLTQEEIPFVISQWCMRSSLLFSTVTSYLGAKLLLSPTEELGRYSHEQGVDKGPLTICFSNYSKRVIWVPAPAPALPTSKHDGFHASLLARLLACPGTTEDASMVQWEKKG